VSDNDIVTYNKDGSLNYGGDMSELLTEKFFTEVKGWEWKPNRIDKTGHRGEGWYQGDKFKGFCNNLHNSLDLQEEWLWPELRKKYFNMVRFIDTEDNGEFYECAIWGQGKDRRISSIGEGPTKALAQLEAGLKALGVI